MADTFKCPECDSGLYASDTKCKRCGWVMPGAPKAASAPQKPPIQCCFTNCIEGAICRVFTKTGWANVCRMHYTKIDFADKPAKPDSLAMIETRNAYHASRGYKDLNGGTAVTPTSVIDLPPRINTQTREPGEDTEELPLGIGRDPLEEEFMGESK